MTDLGRAATGNDDGQPTSTGNAAGFFGARWRGEASLGLLIWRDMFLAGSALNAAASMAALWLVGMGAPPLMALPVHFALVPYNVFLTLCIWRTAERGGGSTVGYMLAAAAWLMLVTVI